MTIIFCKSLLKSHDNSSEIQLTISGINCAACGWLIEKQLAKIQGINKVGVNVSARRATVTWDNQQLKFSQILSTLKKLVITRNLFKPNNMKRHLDKKIRLFKTLGLAGLMTMQVMMLNIGVFFDLVWAY